ncbi:MAG: DUF433 domain-containing protein [Chthoniobacteraceae bacterium]
MNPHDIITVDAEILGGTPVFRGTRVPVKTLFDYLSDSLSLDYFLESFPSVPRELAVAVLRYSQQDIEPKLSHGGGWRGLCRWAERWRRSAAQAVTAGAVGCSAWLGVGCIGVGIVSFAGLFECLADPVGIIGIGVGGKSLLAKNRVKSLNGFGRGESD